MRPESLTGLYWSIRGTVLCQQHAPEAAEDRWTAESWCPLPESSQGFHGDRYQCQLCSPDGTAVAHANGRLPSPFSSK